jgi:hypothetical protein
MKKEELARAIFEEQNRIHELKGEQPIDINTPRAQCAIWENSKNTKAELERELELTRKYYDVQVAKNQREAKLAAYFATPEGATFKAETEQAIENKKQEWKELDQATTQALEEIIQAALGKDWGICRYKKGYVEIGVIDSENSTPERQEFYFGQYIEVRYEERHWLDKREVFEANCGSTGSFLVEGGMTTGQRAMFYVGIGRLLGDAELVANLKTILREASQKTDLLSQEYNELESRLENPFSEVE